MNKVSALKLIMRQQTENLSPSPEGGIAPSLELYREQGHFRLHRETCETKCVRCPFGLNMATQLNLDQWDRSKVKWRFETHCYGPRSCPKYKAGPPYKVPGRKGMVYVDDLGCLRLAIKLNYADFFSAYLARISFIRV